MKEASVKKRPSHLALVATVRAMGDGRAASAHDGFLQEKENVLCSAGRLGWRTTRDARLKAPHTEPYRHTAAASGGTCQNCQHSLRSGHG